ncbi:MAG: ArsC family transcriptional regulator [Clostridiales bacterium]|nr:ArsC family transcriptional regulator [Clostridiales bacterium]
MAIQIYALKKGFDVQKAERYFKERRIPYQFVDLSRHAMGLRELMSVAAQVGVQALIDVDGKAYQEHYIGHLRDDEAILKELAARPALLRTPIVRNGRLATVGFAPDVWAGWPPAK